MQNIKKYAVAALLFILPLIFPGRMMFGMRPSVFSQWTVIVVSLSLFAFTLKIPLSIRLFYMWCIITTFTSRIPQISAIAFLFITLILLLFAMMLRMKREDLQFSNRIIVYAMCVQVLWIFIQAMNRDFVMNLPRDTNFIFGTMGNKNLLGALFLFSIVPIYRFRKWAIALPIIGILYCKASASIFALGGGFVFILLFMDFKRHIGQAFSQHFTKALLILCIFMSCMLLWKYVDNPFVGFTEGRLPIWKKITDLMFEKRTAASVIEARFKPTKAILNDMITTFETDMNKKRKFLFWEWKPNNYDLYVSKLGKAKTSLAEINKIEQEAKGKAEKVLDAEFIENIRNPWLGYGLGTFKLEFPKRLTVKEAGGKAKNRKTNKYIKRSDGTYQPIQWRQAHSTYLQVGRESGLIGMFLLLCVPGMMFAKFLRSKKTPNLIWAMGGVVMICLNAIGNFPDRNIALMFYMLFVFVMFYKEVYAETLCVDRVTSSVSRYFRILQFQARQFFDHKRRNIFFA